MSYDLVTVAILAKDKGHALPLYLESIEKQTYPASRINLYIRTNNNNDNTAEILQEWVQRVGELYNEVYLDTSDVEERVQDFEPHDWNQTKLRVLAKLRQDSIQWALERNSHYFVMDCDNFVVPETLERLVETHLPVIGPLLTVADNPLNHYSNYHFAINEQGYFQQTDEYFTIRYQIIRGLIQVGVIHCAYLIRREVLEKVRYEDGSGRHEYVIVSDGLRKAGIPQYIDNRQVYGLLTFTDTTEKMNELGVRAQFEALLAANE